MRMGRYVQVRLDTQVPALHIKKVTTAYCQVVEKLTQVVEKLTSPAAIVYFVYDLRLPIACEILFRCGHRMCWCGNCCKVCK